MEQLEELVGAEILELTDGETKVLHITRWTLGRMTIHPANAPLGKMIRVLRVWVPPVEKAIGPDYWDITSQTLIYQLMPFLEREPYRRRTYTITKHGVAPRARFTLVVS